MAIFNSYVKLPEGIPPAHHPNSSHSTHSTSGAPFPSISALEDTIEGHAEAVV